MIYCFNLNPPDLLDSIYKIATVLIAIVNIGLIFYIFVKDGKKNDLNKIKDRKLSRLDTLILNYNLKHLYDFFDKIEQELEGLKKNHITDDEKKIIIEKTDDLFIFFRRKFIDILLSIDHTL